MPTLVLIRHGATRWGQENRFAGWGDTPLSVAGWTEARKAAQTLRRANLEFDVAYCSRLLRARETLEAITKTMAAESLPVVVDWRLNERHYGQLQEVTRPAAIAEHGNAQVVAWRRDYHAVPPLLEDDDPRWLEQVARFADIDPTRLPRGESLGDAAARVRPVFEEEIGPALKAGKRVLVVAHTSSIRGLARVIENLDDEASAAFRIATAIPRLYQLDDDLTPQSSQDLAGGGRAGVRYWANKLKPRGLGRF